jgi:ubiquitin carboxyl-terminal hydrolase 34
MSISRGIQNPGSICYATSLLQQLAHIPFFCDCIEQYQDNSEFPLTSLLYSLKIIFNYIHSKSISNHQNDLIESSLVNIIRDSNGDFLSLNDQQDVVHYFSNLLSLIRKENSEFTNQLLNQSIQGDLIHNITEGDKNSKRNEKFNFISINVKKYDPNNTFENSLNEFTRETIFSIDSPNKDERKISKSTKFLNLPNNLIFHLRRFEFNHALKKTQKIQSKFVFPQNIDLGPYMDDSIGFNTKRLDLASDRYSYELSGVIIHTGTASSGHYYSLVRIRTKLKSNSYMTDSIFTNEPSARSSGQWLKLDDENVTNFDIENLSQVAFGENISKHDDDDDDDEEEEEEEKKSESAVMLFYDQINSS